MFWTARKGKIPSSYGRQYPILLDAAFPLLGDVAAMEERDHNKQKKRGIPLEDIVAPIIFILVLGTVTFLVLHFFEASSSDMTLTSTN